MGRIVLGSSEEKKEKVGKTRLRAEWFNAQQRSVELCSIWASRTFSVINFQGVSLPDMSSLSTHTHTCVYRGGGPGEITVASVNRKTNLSQSLIQNSLTLFFSIKCTQAGLVMDRSTLKLQCYWKCLDKVLWSWHQCHWVTPEYSAPWWSIKPMIQISRWYKKGCLKSSRM